MSQPERPVTQSSEQRETHFMQTVWGVSVIPTEPAGVFMHRVRLEIGGLVLTSPRLEEAAAYERMNAIAAFLKSREPAPEEVAGAEVPELAPQGPGSSGAPDASGPEENEGSAARVAPRPVKEASPTNSDVGATSDRIEAIVEEILRACIRIDDPDRRKFGAAVRAILSRHLSGVLQDAKPERIMVSPAMLEFLRSSQNRVGSDGIPLYAGVPTEESKP